MKVLIVSPFFAPCTLVGALRMTSLVQFLVHSGEEVSVIKIKDCLLDNDMTTGVKVEGVRYYEIDSFPDEKTYGGSLFHQIELACHDNKYDCCVASFGPFEGINEVTKIKEVFSVPIVVDYRDLWLYHPKKSTSLKSVIVRNILLILNKRKEKKLLKACDWFVSVTPRSVSTMIQHYPLLKNKSECIFNGYTELELMESPGNSNKETKIFVLGKFAYYSPTGALSLLIAVKNLICKGYQSRIVHLGAKEKELNLLARKIGFPEQYLSELGQYTYDEMLRKACEADVFVSLEEDSEGIPTKIFDYILLNKPILSYGPIESEYNLLLREAENAYVCRSSDEMENALIHIIENNQIVLTSDESFRAKFSRKKQNQLYYALLKSVGSVSNEIKG